MRIPPPLSHRIRRTVPGLMVLLAGALGLWSCQLGQDPKVEDLASFDKLYDSLSIYDSVVIVFEDANGTFLDTVYQGKVDTHEELRNLPVRGWDGKRANIIIAGFNEGLLVYEIEKKFDGSSNETDANIIVVTPGTALSCDIRELTLAEGDSLGLPNVTVTPSVLSDKTLLWSSSDSGVLAVGPDFLKAVRRGSADLLVKLRSNPAKNLRITVTIVADTRTPDSLYVQPDTLRLAAEGAAGRLTVRVSPSSADGAVTWKTADPAIATVSAEGMANGLKPGHTWVWAVSKRKASLTDSSLVMVSEPVAVQTVRFLKNPATLYVGGSSDTLAVAVLPVQANSEVLFSFADSGLISIKDNKATGLAPGRTRIIARSKTYPAIADTLQVTVLAGHPVEKVVIADKTLGPAYVGGAAVRLSASVLPPDAPQTVQWKTPHGAIASIDDSGRVTGRSPGLATVYAISLADSSKKDSAVIQIKRDMPQLNPGRDTTVSLGTTVAFTPTATKQNGTLVLFKWDLDGDLAWDDSSAALKTVSRKYDAEKEYTARFYVRDSQGNDTLASIKVKVVKGLVVLIQSPLNNAYTNKSPMKVAWTVDGKAQDTLPLEPLKEGANVLTRTARDSAGTSFSATVTVNYDITPPNKPLVHGTALVATATPTWSWATGGSAGAGIFRYGLDAETFPNPETKDTAYTPAAALAGGTHTLYVQERDAAGNWSLSGLFATNVDLTPPLAPAVTATASPTNDRTPTWTWSTRGGGSGNWRYKLGDRNLAIGATETAIASYTPTTDLAAGTYTLHVQERDSAGNWSPSDSASVTVDISAPGTPQVSASPSSPTKNQKPTWTWKSGTASTGNFRYKLNDADLSTGATATTAMTFTPATDLAAGSWTLYVQEKNAAGTWSASGSAAVRIDTTRPKTPTVNVTPGSPASDRRPVWSWNKQEAGVGFFRYRLNTAAARDTGSTSFQPSVAGQLVEGSYTLYVQEGDSAGNWSDEASAPIRLDLTPPTAPTVNGTASPTNSTTPTWTWVAGTGGNGNFRYRLNDSTMTGATATTQLSYTSTALAAGTYTLYVQEKDSAGNWSPRGAYPIVIDLTPPGAPTLNASSPPSPLNTLKPTWSWTSGGGGNGTFQVKLGDNNFSSGGITVTGTTYTPPNNLPEGAQILFVRERDAAGNWSASSPGRTIFLAPRLALGGLGFPGVESSEPKILVTSTGVLYAAYVENVTQTITVKRYQPSNNAWVNAGSNAVGINYLYDFALNPVGDVPYVVGYKISGDYYHVRRLNSGGTWEDVGDPSTNATRISGDKHCLAFTSTGTPYMALKDLANGGKIALWKFSGLQWDPANATLLGTEPYDLAIAMGPNNLPYVAFQDNVGFGVYVMTPATAQYTANWVTVGSGAAFNNGSPTTGLKLKTYSNQIYLGVHAGGSDNTIKLLSSSGGAFGSPYSVSGSDFALALGSTGTPYLALQGGAGLDEIQVIGRFGATWSPVGVVLQSAGQMMNPSLAVTGDGVPLIGYQDWGVGHMSTVIRTSFDP